MTHQEFIDTCKYYKGEKTNPFNDDDKRYWYWEIENIYVIRIENDPKAIVNAVTECENIPRLKQLFNSYNNVPSAIISFAFRYYDHYNGDYKTQDEIIDEFILFFNQY